MIKYANEVITKEGYTLSVDMIRLSFRLRGELDLKALYNQLRYSEIGMLAEFKENERMTDYSMPVVCRDVYESKSFKFGKYATMFTIYTSVDREESFCLGVGLQNSRETMLDGFIEFNPNKTDCEALRWLLQFLRKHCTFICIKRYDLALDVPTRADEVHVHKDERKYELQRPSSDPSHDTEYLGCRNTVGRFKKYNKKVEHNKM